MLGEHLLGSRLAGEKSVCVLPSRQTRDSGQLTVAPGENAPSLLLDNESSPEFSLRVIKVTAPFSGANSLPFPLLLYQNMPGNPKDLLIDHKENLYPILKKEFAFPTFVLLFLWAVASVVAVSKMLQAIYIR